jgi:hypothetical protein
MLQQADSQGGSQVTVFTKSLGPERLARATGLLRAYSKQVVRQSDLPCYWNYFRLARLNVAARAADASREVMDR